MSLRIEPPSSIDIASSHTGKARHVAPIAAAAHLRRKTPLCGNFQVSKEGLLKLALLLYLGVAIPFAAVVLSALRMGGDSTRPLPLSTEQSRSVNPVPDKPKARQEEPESADRRSAACIAEKSAETAARLESQGEISHRDKLLFSTPVSEVEHLTSFGQQEIRNFRKVYGIEQICRDLSQS